MISTILATLMMGQTPKLSFTMILVAGNEHQITNPKSITDDSTDPITIGIQKIAKELESTKSSWVIIDGGTISTPEKPGEQTTISSVSCHFDAYVSATQDQTVRGKTKRTFEEKTYSKALEGTSVKLTLHDGRGMFFTNVADGPDKNNLMMTNLSSLPRIEREKETEYIGYLKNSLAVSHQTIWDTEDWLKSYHGEHRPTMVLCASGRPQSGHRDILAFPPSGVILTYTVTFDKRWSAVLKDIIRVQ